MPLDRILLVRHAATKFNSKGLIQGQRDTTLEPGYGPQVDRLADLIAEVEGPPSVVFSSDLSRANLTGSRLAQRLRRRHGYSFDYIATPALRERGEGDLEGKSFQEAFPDMDPGEVYGHLYRADHHSNGETLQDVEARLRRFIGGHMARHQGMGIVVGHLLTGLNYLRNLLVHQDMLADEYRVYHNLAVLTLVFQGRR